MKRQRFLIVGAIAALIVIGIITKGFGLLDDAKSDQLTLYGNVDIRTVDLAFRVPGRIDRIVVEEGQKVTRGQLLAALDTATIRARIAEADAKVAEARAQVAKLRSGSRPQDIAQAEARAAAAAASARNAEADYRRRSSLVGPGAISKAVWQQTLAERDRALAQLAEANQALSLARAGNRREDIQGGEAQLQSAIASRQSVATDLSDAELRAPEDALVDTRAREPGAIVQNGETVLTLAIPRPLRIRAYVAEPDLSRVRPGLGVTVTSDGTAKTYHGVISWIAPKAEITPKTVETESLRTDLVYLVRMKIKDPDDLRRQGQPVTVHVGGAPPIRK
jgi:HlyD family secretion protein